MEQRNVITWALLSVIIVLLMTTGVQAQELTEVSASNISEKIQAGEDIRLENVRIKGELDLSKKIIENEITIKKSVFENDTDFSNTKFIRYLNFQGTSFLGISKFRSATFSEGIYSKGATFGKNAYFDEATFIKNAYFKHATFSGHAFFRDANFKKAYFVRTTFSGSAYFRDANFNDSAAFRSAKFDSLDFYNTSISRLDLAEADFKNLKVDKWDSLKKINHSFDGPTYVNLIKSFREREQFVDADAAYIKYKQVSEADKNWSFSETHSKLGDRIMELYCGYGVRPWNALGWGIVIISVYYNKYFFII